MPTPRKAAKAPRAKAAGSASSKTGSSSAKPAAKTRKTGRAAPDSPASEDGKTSKPQQSRREPRLLSGGNPQIAKGYGDEAVKEYLAAAPGWKQAVCRRLDAIITSAVPGVRKAVKWNTPLYGAPDEASGWFLSFHCFDRYVKVAFFRGASLRPPPPVASKVAGTRYLHVPEEQPGDKATAFDERQFRDWVMQASALPGEKM